MTKKLVCIILISLCINCSENNLNKNISDNSKNFNNPEELYKLANLSFKYILF